MASNETFLSEHLPLLEKEKSSVNNHIGAEKNAKNSIKLKSENLNNILISHSDPKLDCDPTDLIISIDESCNDKKHICENTSNNPMHSNNSCTSDHREFQYEKHIPSSNELSSILLGFSSMSEDQNSKKSIIKDVNKVDSPVGFFGSSVDTSNSYNDDNDMQRKCELPSKTLKPDICHSSDTFISPNLLVSTPEKAKMDEDTFSSNSKKLSPNPSFNTLTSIRESCEKACNDTSRDVECIKSTSSDSKEVSTSNFKCSRSDEKLYSLHPKQECSSKSPKKLIRSSDYFKQYDKFASLINSKSSSSYHPIYKLNPNSSRNISTSENTRTKSGDFDLSNNLNHKIHENAESVAPKNVFRSSADDFRESNSSGIDECLSKIFALSPSEIQDKVIDLLKENCALRSSLEILNCALFTQNKSEIFVKYVKLDFKYSMLKRQYRNLIKEYKSLNKMYSNDFKEDELISDFSTEYPKSFDCKKSDNQSNDIYKKRSLLNNDLFHSYSISYPENNLYNAKSDGEAISCNLNHSSNDLKFNGPLLHSQSLTSFENQPRDSVDVLVSKIEKQKERKFLQNTASVIKNWRKNKDIFKQINSFHIFNSKSEKNQKAKSLHTNIGIKKGSITVEDFNQDEEGLPKNDRENEKNASNKEQKYSKKSRDSKVSSKLKSSRDSRSGDASHDLKVKDASHDLKVKDASHDLKVKDASHDSKVIDASHDSKVIDASHDSKVKDASHDLKVKDASHDLKVKDASHDLKVKDASHDSKVKDASHDSKVIDASHDSKVIDASHDSKVIDASHDSKVKDASHDLKVIYPNKDRNSIRNTQNGKNNPSDPSTYILIQSHWILNYSDCYFIKKLGVGSTATVYLGKWKQEQVAIKVLREQHRKQDFEDFKKEMEIISELRSSYIVHFFGVTITPKFCILLEYCSNGTLFHYLRNEKSYVDWRLCFRIMREAFKGIKALHSFKPQIVHRDLKSLNLLLDSHMQVKVCDFGLSRLVKDKQESTSFKIKGTYTYYDPDVYKSGEFTTKSDIYSMGIVLYEIVFRLMTGKYCRPYSEYPFINNDLQIIVQAARGLRPTLPKNVPEKIAALYEDCTNKDSCKRPDAENVSLMIDEISNYYEDHTDCWNPLVSCPVITKPKPGITRSSARELVRNDLTIRNLQDDLERRGLTQLIQRNRNNNTKSNPTSQKK